MRRNLLELLGKDRLRRLEGEAEHRGVSLRALFREAIDRLLSEQSERRAAGDRLLSASPMAVEDWEEMKRTIMPDPDARLE